MKEHAVVVGAGLVGSLQALLLAKKGYKVDVYEGRGDIREVDFIGGRSINLALSNRGWKALELAGVGKEIRDISIAMHSRLMHSVDGELTYQAYGQEGEAIYSVPRGELNRQVVLKASEFENVTFHFEHKCLDVDLDKNVLTFLDRKSGKEIQVEADRIYATDGAFSAVRKRMQRMDRFNYSQEYLKHGYKELVIPPNPDGSHRIDKNALHIWPRGQYMLIALANQDGSFTVTLFFPFEGPVSFKSLDSDEKIMAFFQEQFPDAVPLKSEARSLNRGSSGLIAASLAVTIISSRPSSFDKSNVPFALTSFSSPSLTVASTCIFHGFSFELVFISKLPSVSPLTARFSISILP